MPKYEVELTVRAILNLTDADEDEIEHDDISDDVQGCINEALYRAEQNGFDHPIFDEGSLSIEMVKTNSVVPLD